jgi:hypothetical protein
MWVISWLSEELLTSQKGLWPGVSCVASCFFPGMLISVELSETVCNTEQLVLFENSSCSFDMKKVYKWMTV